MKKKILTITLNPAVDKAVKVLRFKVGDDFREKALFLSAGGKGVNVSQVLRHVGAQTITGGFLGGPAGGYIKRELDKDGIRHSFSNTAGNTRTSLTILDPSLNTITRILERGPEITRKELNLFRKRYLSLLNGCGAVVLSGRNIPGAPDSLYAELISAAKKRGVFTVLDTSGRPYLLGIKKKPSMIKPNQDEVRHLTGRGVLKVSGLKSVARDLYGRGIKIVAITMGSRGAVVYNGRDMVVAVPPKLKRTNPIGCGDSFIAGFLAYMVRGLGFTDCVRMAVACGAANALSIDPGSVKRSEVKRMYNKVRISHER